MEDDVNICLELQKEELVAISSIYGDNFLQVSEDSFELSLVCEGSCWWSITVRISLPSLYPLFQPPLYQIFSECFTDDDLLKIKQGVDEIWGQYKGECVLFMWIEKCREILHKGKDENPTRQESLVSTEGPDGVTYDKELAANELPSMSEVIARQHDVSIAKRQQQEVMTECLCSLDTYVPEIISGEAIIDRKSIFQGHVAYVETEEEVRKVILKLKENRKIARATHNIMAYRVASSRTDTFHQDCDDDGESEAGGRLMHLLQILNAKNVVVVVSRWYGGIHLGPDRFKHINNCARDLIVKSGIFTDTKEQKATVNKKRMKKCKKN